MGIPFPEERSAIKDDSKRLKPGLRRLAIRLLHPIWVIVLVVFIVVSLEHWHRRQLQEAHDATAESSGKFETLRQASFDNFATIYQVLLLEKHLANQPLDQVTIDNLKHYRTFFENYLQDETTRSDGSKQRIEAHVNLARIHNELNNMRGVETHYHSAGELLATFLRKSKPTFEDMFLQAQISNRLSWARATLGRAAEARDIAKEADSQLASLAKRYPNHSNVMFERALTLRNLGLIETGLGGNGIEQLRLCLEIVRDLISTGSQMTQSSEHRGSVRLFVLISEFHIDVSQLLSAILWRSREFLEAETLCMQTQESLTELRAYIDSHALTSPFPVLKYKTAHRLIQSNARSIRRDRTAAQPEHQESFNILSGSCAWEWDALYALPEHCVPAELYFSTTLHAEFEKQEAIVVSWLDVKWCEAPLVSIAKALHKNVRLIVLVSTSALENEAKFKLSAAGVSVEDIRFIHAKTETLWVRDFGPLVVESSPGVFKCVDTVFNKETRSSDDHLPQVLSKAIGQTTIPSPIVLEGGAILCNGAGLCLASSNLLKLNDEVGYSESHLTSTIKRLTGSTEVIYLDPLRNETTGHVDIFATFVAADTLVLGDYESGDSWNRKLLNNHGERLKGITTPAGPLKVVRIPMPESRSGEFGGTFTNVVFANGVLLVPTWPRSSAKLEEKALAVYRDLLPNWNVIGIDSDELGKRGGGLHCATLNLQRITPKLQELD